MSKTKRGIILIIFVSLFYIITPFVKINALTFENPLSASTTAVSPQEIFSRLIKNALGVVGILSLVFFVWGGFIWMSSAGNQDKVKQGKDTILWATLGLVAIFVSYAVLTLILDTLSTDTISMTTSYLSSLTFI